MTDDLLWRIAQLEDLYARNLATLSEQIADLEAANRALRREVAEAMEALTPFAHEPISTDPHFHRTRPFSLRHYDKVRRNARRVLGVPLDQPDPMDTLSTINQELKLDE